MVLRLTGKLAGDSDQGGEIVVQRFSVEFICFMNVGKLRAWHHDGTSLRAITRYIDQIKSSMLILVPCGIGVLGNIIDSAKPAFLVVCKAIAATVTYNGVAFIFPVFINPEPGNSLLKRLALDVESRRYPKRIKHFVSFINGAAHENSARRIVFLAGFWRAAQGR